MPNTYNQIKYTELYETKENMELHLNLRKILFEQIVCNQRKKCVKNFK